MQTRTSLSQRALIWAFTVVLALGVSGCSSEAKDRKALVDFLQTRIVDKPGMSLPLPTPQEEKSFGEYNKHFAVIRDFNLAMDKKISAPMKDLMTKGMPRSMPELMGRSADLAAMRETTAALRTSVDAELARADAGRAALKQADDLKAVYDKAYTRTVTAPAKMVKEFMPAIESTLESAEKLAAFLEAHKDKVKFSGSMIEIKDAALLAEANVLMANMGARSNEIMDAQRRMNAMVTGR